MIGIDISDQAIKIVRLSSKKQAALLGYCVKQIPHGAIVNGVVVQEKVVQSVLQEVLTACRIPGRTNEPVVISIPEKQSFLRVIEIPEMSSDEVSEAILWEVAQHIPFPVESMYLDWQPISVKGHVAAKGRIEVQVGAAQKEVVDKLYKTLVPMKLDVAAFELEGQALVRSLVSKELQEKQGLLLIDLGKSATNVTIHDHGALRFTSTLPKGVSHVTEGESVVEAKMDELVAQVHGIAEFYNSIDAQHVVKEIILTGGGATMSGLGKSFLKFFENVHVELGNPWVNVISGVRHPKPPMEAKESARYSVAVGLALRDVPI